jgi:hypothetical protein
MSNDVRALISHYVQLGFFRHIQTVCDEVIKKRGKDSTLTFWHSYGVGCEGQGGSMCGFPIRCFFFESGCRQVPWPCCVPASPAATSVRRQTHFDGCCFALTLCPAGSFYRAGAAVRQARHLYR